jgi:hypothetical protein
MAIKEVLSGISGAAKQIPLKVLSQSGKESVLKNALGEPVAVSDSGNTAVGTQGTGQKIFGTLLKGGLEIAKHIPGAPGLIASIASNFLNDPEWWESVKGDQLTTNDPLRVIETEKPSYALPSGKTTNYARYAMVEYLSWHKSKLDTGDNAIYPAIEPTVIDPNMNMITQYLMPQIRSVVNAVPLQDAADYGVALRSAVAIYAIWQQLKKFDYMLKHGNTYIQSLNDPAFPLFQTANASWLQGTINRLEEYLKSSVRLPHTMCEYLAFRFGRVYRSNDSAKAGIVLYNAMPIRGTTELYDAAIKILMDAITTNTNVQKANADMYNAYKDHDYKVVVRDDTQFAYDRKEFCLRCNITSLIQSRYDGGVDTLPSSDTTNRGRLAAGEKLVDCPAQPVMMDSSLDNATVFMASTVSALGLERASKTPDILFPVAQTIQCFIPMTWYDGSNYQDSRPPRVCIAGTGSYTSVEAFLYVKLDWVINPSNNGTHTMGTNVGGSAWAVEKIQMDHIYVPTYSAGDTEDIFGIFAAVKALDLYNHGIFIPCCSVNGQGISVNYSDANLFDMTTLSIDEGQPTTTTLETEHVYAFANLVEITRKHSESYKVAEKELAADVANTIEKLDVATIAEPKN